MKKLFLFLLFLCVTDPLVHATTRNAASCNASDVQAQINLSANGDTVLLPGGTCTWDGTHTVTISASQQITLNGNNTTINFGGNGTSGTNGVFSVTAGTTTYTFVTGFTFNGAYVGGNFPIKVSTGISPLTKTYRFYNNTFNYTGTGLQAGTIVGIFGNGPGLWDHNTWYTTVSNTEIIHLNNDGNYQDYSSWNQDVVPGGPNMTFFEDNTFTYPQPQPPAGYNVVAAIEAYYGSKMVWRYNKMYSTYVDVHGTGLGATACTVQNGRWWEIYNNQFFPNPDGANQYAWLSIRGGSGVAFNNTASGNNSGGGNIILTSDCADGSGYSWPIPGEVGRGITTTPGNTLTTYASPAYLWNNTNLTQNHAMPFWDSEGTGWVVAGRDYFSSTSQPATLNRCESAADIAAGCPVSYTYTPYTYPHPLTNGSQAAAPAPPSSLTVTVQ
jgi:hypothetical protein